MYCKCNNVSLLTKYSSRTKWSVLEFSGIFKASMVTRLMWNDVHISGLAFSLNRVFVVETFSMLISQRQTLVSSDTSCAMGNRRDFFLLSHSLSSLYFLFLSPATLSLWALTESEDPNQQTSVNAAQAVKMSFVMNDFSQTPPVYKYGSFKTFIPSCAATNGRTSRTHSALASCPARSMWLKL